MRKVTENKTLYVGGINLKVKQEEIAKLFSKYGTVVNVIMNNKKSKDEFNYCFVEMLSADQAQECFDKLNNKELKGDEIFLRF